MEVINDINGEVANLFRILQRHYPQFLEVLRFQITTPPMPTNGSA
jgi:DNA adenine methylase